MILDIEDFYLFIYLPYSVKIRDYKECLPCSIVMGASNLYSLAFISSSSFSILSNKFFFFFSSEFFLFEIK